METGHVPTRRCIACGAHAPKAQLARFVLARADGGWALLRDDRARLPGRGLYICRRRACFDRAVTRRAFARAARRTGEPVAVDSALADALD